MRDAQGQSATRPAAMRIDRLLVYLRFVRTRSAASRLIATRTLRRNRIHVQRASEKVSTGDVLTLALGKQVRVIEVLSLPDRRGSPEQARSHYRELERTLDREGAVPLAAPRKAATRRSGQPGPLPGQPRVPDETKDPP